MVESIPKCHEEESQEEAECSSKFSHLKEMNGQHCEKQYSPSKLNFLKNNLPDVDGMDGPLNAVASTKIQQCEIEVVLFQPMCLVGLGFDIEERN